MLFLTLQPSHTSIAASIRLKSFFKPMSSARRFCWTRQGQKTFGRFVQISTDEVMGSLPDDSDDYFTEDSPLQPNSPYAASKAAAEFMVRAARETFGVDTVITRCGNNYGPRQFPEKLIPLMIANAMNDEPLPFTAMEMNVRDWIYVDDHCRAIWLAYKKGRAARFITSAPGTSGIISTSSDRYLTLSESRTAL